LSVPGDEIFRQSTCIGRSDAESISIANFVEGSGTLDEIWGVHLRQSIVLPAMIEAGKRRYCDSRLVMVISLSTPTQGFG